ncbi:hypothetical protein AX17_006530 [Amanita inopinata Kibby_2008]|nr:hypothetical protein AX17_006530 [Amanita inopinata Kibby_2008]
MAPFEIPKAVLSGFKEKVDSLTVQDDRLYLGTAQGSLHIYGFEGTGEGEEPQLKLVEVRKSLTKRSIEQLGFIKDINSLVILSEATVTLFPLPTFSPPTPLVKAKTALSFAVYSTFRRLESAGESGGEQGPGKIPVPTLVTLLLVGCRRKVVLYSWQDGEAQDVKEVPLPHSPRVITFLDHETACFAYSATEHAIFQFSTMTATEISLPPPVTATSAAKGALTGLSGYMTLGFGAKAKPCVVAVDELEALVVKDNQGAFIGKDGKNSRSTAVEWPAPPEETTFIKPYLFSVLPAGTVPVQTSDGNPPSSANVAQSHNQTTVIQIRSSLSLSPIQTLSFPFHDISSFPSPASPPTPSNAPSPTTIQNATVRLLTPSGHVKPRLFMITMPTDRTAAASEGSTVWQINMRPWAEQLEELVLAGQYSDALTLLGVIDETSLPDKDQRRKQLRILNAVSQFKSSNYDAAIDTFTELDLNPAKVVALYPESIAGRLAISAEKWIPLFGGPAPAPAPATLETRPQEEEEAPTSDLTRKGDGKGELAESPRRYGESEKGGVVDSRSFTGFEPSIGSGLPMSASTRSRLLWSDTASISSQRKVIPDEFHLSVETLVRYLSDRRPKIGAALQAVGITPQFQSHEIAPLSETAVDELFGLPDAPLSTLTPEQLLRFAQIVDTALYKSYLIIRPVLLGSLCRVPNWCEVTEVEEDLRMRQKFAELKDLYFGKKMHARALNLLKELSEKEDDAQDKLWPTINYLQKLGPEHLDQIFKSARWAFGIDQDMAFEIFTSEDVELPRQAVANYLESIDVKICAKYLEYIISERHEEKPEYHDQLAVIYLDMTLAAKRQNGSRETGNESYNKLLAFIDSDQYYSVSRLYSLVSPTDLFEARAILLGRLGRHDQTLELYVYRLHDFAKAEEYCKRIYQAGTETNDVFLTLLRIYLRPTVKTDLDLLRPALDLISWHSSRLDSVETLKFLPPLVTTRDVGKFLVEALRVPLFDTRIIREVSKARNEYVSRKLVALQTRRVKVTDSRICPQCHKRIGNSVIAVHAPRGEVTHYQCREAFSRKLDELRA